MVVDFRCYFQDSDEDKSPTGSTTNTPRVTQEDELTESEDSVVEIDQSGNAPEAHQMVPNVARLPTPSQKRQLDETDSDCDSSTNYSRRHIHKIPRNIQTIISPVRPSNHNQHAQYASTSDSDDDKMPATSTTTNENAGSTTDHQQENENGIASTNTQNNNTSETDINTPNTQINEDNTTTHLSINDNTTTHQTPMNPVVELAPNEAETTTDNEVRLFQQFHTIPVNKNLNSVPARLMADVDSMSMLSSSLSKIIANLDYNKGGSMKVRNNFDRRYCNVSSRYYIKPNDNFKVKYANGQLVKNPVKISLLPNIRLFEIIIDSVPFNLSFYLLDDTRNLGRNHTSYLNDRSLLCIVIAFNIVRQEWDSFPSVSQHFYELKDLSRVGQIMQNIQPFFVQKQGATSDPNPVTIDLKFGLMFLLMFERAMRRLASPHWKGNYKWSLFNGNFTSISDSEFQKDELLLRAQAEFLCTNSFFDLSAVGIKFVRNKLETFIPNLRDEQNFIKQHKMMCRMVTNRFREQLSDERKENETLVLDQTNHEFVTGIDIGLELYPIVPGTTFVLNGKEAKQLSDKLLARTMEQEKEYETTTQILQPANNDSSLTQDWDSEEEDELCDWKSHQCEYNETCQYVYDADYFNSHHAEELFCPDGTPRDESIMNDDGSFVVDIVQHKFEQCDDSRVVLLGNNVLANFIPNPTKHDCYLQTLQELTQDEMQGTTASDRMDVMEISNEVDLPLDNENAPQDNEEQETSAEPLIQLIEEIMEEPETTNENAETRQNSTNAIPNAGPNSALNNDPNTLGNDQSDLDEDRNISLELLMELKEQNKKTRVFPQFLSNGKIANIHHEQIYIELVRSDPLDPFSHLTIKLCESPYPKCCDGANVYMPYTRSMFSKQSSKRQELEALFIPYLVSNMLSDVMKSPGIADYKRLQKLVTAQKMRVDELLKKLRENDRQPIRQELTFATNDFWNRKFRWPSDQTVSNTSHVGVADSRHLYFFARKICLESIKPLIYLTRTPEIPNFALISPQAKTGVVYMAERIMKIFQHFGFSGNIMKLFRRHYKQIPEASPPDEVVVAITKQDQENTMLPYGLKTECLPVYAVNPIKLAPAFRKGVQANMDLFMLDMAKNIQMTTDYLLFGQASLSVLQQYTKDCGKDNNQNIIGPYVAKTNEEMEENDQNSIAPYKNGFFDRVNFEELSKLSELSIANLFRDVASLLCTAYRGFMLKRLNNKYAFLTNQTPPLTRVPYNTTELNQIVRENVGNRWAEKLMLSFNCTMSSLPDLDRKNIIDPSKCWEKGTVDVMPTKTDELTYHSDFVLNQFTETLCEMLFLVPTVKHEKMEKAWSTAPEKHLFHDFMHVIQRVSNATTDNYNMTMWTDYNFIQVLFDEYIRSATYSDVTKKAKSIAWVTQPSRKYRFLGVCRPVFHPNVREDREHGHKFIALHKLESIRWFTTGYRCRGNIGRRSNGRATNQTDETENEMNSYWSTQQAIIDRLLQVQATPTNGQTASATPNLQQQQEPNSNRIIDHNEEDDFGNEHGSDEDIITDNPNTNLTTAHSRTVDTITTGTQQAQIDTNNGRNVNHGGANNATIAETRNHIPIPNNHLARNNQVARIPIEAPANQMGGRQLGELLENSQPITEITMDFASNCRISKFFILPLRPPVDKKIKAPSWCPFFRKGKKTNLFANLMHPNHWVDKQQKKRTALDVLVVRLILVEIFKIMFKRKCSIEQAKRDLKNENIYSFPFAVANSKQVATFSSLFVKNADMKDKIDSIYGWMQFFQRDSTISCVRDIIELETFVVNQYIVSGALHSLDENIINRAVFNHTPGGQPVTVEQFQEAVTPIPENAVMTPEMIEINTSIIWETDYGSSVRSFLMAKNAFAQGNISYVVTRRIWIEFQTYSRNKNTYMSSIQYLTDDECLPHQTVFQNYLQEMG